jgi:hypothetical protein
MLVWKEEEEEEGVEMPCRSRSTICWRKKRIRCSCSVACISASRTKERAIFSSADTYNMD